MRELSMSELELVSGGYNTDHWEPPYDLGELDPVTPGGGGGGGGWDWGDWGDWGDYGDGGGGGGGGGGTSEQTGLGDGKDPQKDCDADQVAREITAKFFRDAAAEDQHIAYRERGAFIIRDEDGTLRMSGYQEGAPMAGSVDLDPSELTPTNAIGYVHNHPGGGSTLSGPDRDILASYQEWIKENGGTQEFRMYLVATDGKIFVFDVDNMNDDTSTLEVSKDC